MEKIIRGEDTERCIALIDYENCSNLKNISLKEYTELIIFTGPLQQNVVLPAYFHERRSLNNFHRDRVITFEQIAE
ncbi:gpF1 [Escherichia coli H120]|nr:gpF1 [Escherichia coli H120]GDN42623.1 hypothetical protein BvCmsNSNP042_04146 [Escherichia coli]